MAREIDFSPLARYTARQQQNEDKATQLLTGSLANAGKTFEPLLRQGFSQKMIADAGERPWEVLGKLAAYNPEMYKSFAPEAKQAHLAHISKETDFSAKLQDLEEKQRRLDALKEEKRKWHEPQFEKRVDATNAFLANELSPSLSKQLGQNIDGTIEEIKNTPLEEYYTQTVKPFDPVADARFMYPVTADKGGLLRQTGKPPIENEIAIAEAELNAARKALQPVLKTDEVIPTLDNEKVLKARQQALVNEGYIEEAKRLESNLLSDEQRFLNALGKTTDDISTRIMELEDRLDAPTTTEARKKEIETDIQTLRGLRDYIDQGKRPFRLSLDSWIEAGRKNSNLDFSKNPLGQHNGDGNVGDGGGNGGDNPENPNTPQNPYSGVKTPEEVEVIFNKNLEAVKAESTFKNDAAKKEWVEKQIGLVNDNAHLKRSDKANFEKWAREKMKNVVTVAQINAEENAKELDNAKLLPGFKAIEKYDKFAGQFANFQPETAEDIPAAFESLKAQIDSKPDDLFSTFLLDGLNKLGSPFDFKKLFSPEAKPTVEDWNKLVKVTFGLEPFEEWFGKYKGLMTKDERDKHKTKINGIKSLMGTKKKKKPLRLSEV